MTPWQRVIAGELDGIVTDQPCHGHSFFGRSAAWRTCPRAERAENLSAAPLGRPEVIGQHPPSGHQAEQMRILVVEDDPTISELIAYGLRREGYRVEQEEDGGRAVERTFTDSVDLVLLDVMLPSLDGVRAARMIKQARPTLPVVMLTARGGREAMLAGFAAGVDDYVTNVVLPPFQATSCSCRARYSVGLRYSRL